MRIWGLVTPKILFRILGIGQSTFSPSVPHFQLFSPRRLAEEAIGAPPSCTSLAQHCIALKWPPTFKLVIYDSTLIIYFRSPFTIYLFYLVQFCVESLRAWDDLLGVHQVFWCFKSWLSLNWFSISWFSLNWFSLSWQWSESQALGDCWCKCAASLLIGVIVREKIRRSRGEEWRLSDHWSLTPQSAHPTYLSNCWSPELSKLLLY